MHSTRLLFVAAALLAASCGDDSPSSKQNGNGDTNETEDAGKDAGHDARAPALDGASVDARVNVPPATGLDANASSEPTDAGDAGVEATGDDAAMLGPDATIELPEDAGVVVDPGMEPDAEAPAEPDAGPPSPPACDPSVAPVVGKLGLTAIVSGQGLSFLTEAHQPPDSDDWYLVQQNGVIRVLQNGVLRPKPFLDLSAEITLVNDLVYEDRGLVSIEFAPDYASSGRFYVSLTPNRGFEQNLDQIRSYVRSAADPYVADTSQRTDILSLAGSHVYAPSDYTTNIHNGGRITFGPDGMLYLAMGDGGGINCGDSEPNAQQDIGSLFGKLLRLDLSKPPLYAAEDNPFVKDGDPRVLHYGLRNPFRYSFDRLTGDLYLGDVGQDTFEEVDFAPAGSQGLNFGWAHYEGESDATCGFLRPLRAGSVYTPPIVSVRRSTVATGPFSDYNAMIGGVVYRGNALPQLQGVYFFGGFAGARLGALRQCGMDTSPLTPVTKSCNPNTPSEACLRSLDGAPRFTELRAIVEDHAGEMYIVANRDTLFKVVPLP